MTQPSNLSPNLTPDEHADLKLVQKFLINIKDTDIADVVVLYGYKDTDHVEGWKLFTQASGGNVPFSTSLSAARRKILHDKRPAKDLFRELDQFENLWFPRTRALLSRKITPEHREAFLLAFFDALSQQGEDVGVIGSVETLLNRIEALATDETPGAQEAFQILTERGLTPALKERTLALVTQARTFNSLPPDPNPASPIAPQDALAQRREALDSLRLWRNDWAEVFRPVLDYKMLLRLGLRTSKGGRKPK